MRRAAAAQRPDIPPDQETGSRLLSPFPILLTQDVPHRVPNTETSAVLSLGFAGSLADPVNGTIPVTGRIAGRRIELKFDSGPGGTFGGVGPFDALKVGKGQVELTSFGSLRTGNPADSGDWALTPSPLSNQNLSSKAGYNLTLNNASLVGTNFANTSFSTINITNSALQSVSFQGSRNPVGTPILQNSTFQGVNFSGAGLKGADFSGSDLSGANLSMAYLRPT